MAARLDESTERIVTYLSERGIAINVVFFQVFADGNQRFLSRVWLLDPSETQEQALNPAHDKAPWDGEYYVSFGVGPTRTWEDAVRYGFISAGGGRWYTNTLALLSKGDRVWVNIPREGYVGAALSVRYDRSVTFRGTGPSCVLSPHLGREECGDPTMRVPGGVCGHNPQDVSGLNPSTLLQLDIGFAWCA